MDAMRAAVCLLALLVSQSGAQFKSRRVNNPDIPASSFSCVGRHNGYYADVETDCQVYHMCLDRQQFSYQCPNTTRFQQRMMICDHWYQVDCPSAPLAYSANLLIGQRNTPFVGDDEHRALHEAAVRTSKGLLKGLSQPAANALDGSDSSRKPAVTFAPFPRTTATATSTARPFAAPPSSALEAPFEDEQPQRASFFQRSPTSSFAQPFQNQLFQQQPQPLASTAAPVSFTFTPTPSPTPPRFSISFTPSPSFPASGHNLQRAPSPSPSAPSPSPSPSPSPAPASSTFAAPSAPAPSAFAPSAPAPSAPAPSVFSPSAFSPSAPAPGTFAPSAFSPSAFGPSAGPAPSGPAPSGPAPSPFAPSATVSSLKPPSRELEAPFGDYPEPEGNALPTGQPSTAFPSPSAPSSSLFSASTPAPVPAESMTPQQTASFAAPLPRVVGVAPPSRELTPPHYFGSDAPGPLSARIVAAPFASGASALGASAPGLSAPGLSAPSAAASAPAASGPGSFPRPFTAVNSTQRYSLFAATAAPVAASVSASPAPPSRDLEAPLDEGEVDYNTVELKFQDTRRLFFIPTGDTGSGGSGSGGSEATDPVVVIKYPSKSTRNANLGSTALLKSYPEDVKRRVDPKCPHCHPDFVVPGTCSPCVLLR
ncbi:vegetative cell wall protein gp1-like [Thrips palmi]|uniref:Vegetative cell wall protein gp1-like n=1 Tax=Thrips palmi TaxID=161013 RepID=A0A6P8YCJ9_THRPL|nr:vegetative cell wall protein gp1-like [Thrips palmi]